MNRIFYFVIALTALTACTKDRTCTCSDGYSINIKATKSTAGDACEKYATAGIECKIN